LNNNNIMPNILISKNSGYCMGVKRAFSEAEIVADKNKNICIYGEMVHNKIALQILYDKGIILKKNINDIINDPVIENVIIRAHGIPPEEEIHLKNSSKKIFDFTCPKVKQVQLLAEKYSLSGHTIILFGKKDHPEVIGIAGYCKNPHFIIKSLDEAKKLPLTEITNPVLISQTTMNSITFNEISAFLKIQINDIKIFNTLCNSPVKIQENAINLANNVDAMIVVGDKMSANSLTLFEKVKNITKTWFIEDYKELNLEELLKFKKIGITGGSSTPISQIENIKNNLLLFFRNNVGKITLG
jgi:(E)-4-hydroxy-3-methyl-but-2-enyl pyrophosphate reductase